MTRAVGAARPRSVAASVWRALAVVAAMVALVGCADAPGVPLDADGQPDAVLDSGRQVYARQCSQCHGASGQGGRGKKLKDGAAEERYPDIADMIEVVTNGKGSGMPAFADKLEAAEIEAVVRYVREVL